MSSRFNSRAPRGARPGATPASQPSHVFQFTCPSRSTTGAREAVGYRGIVSIHVPLAEHDLRDIRRACEIDGFNSRAPRGARRGTNRPEGTGQVSIHVPLAEHDGELCTNVNDILVSIHVPLAEHDANLLQEHRHHTVSIHVPLAEHDL